MRLIAHIFNHSWWFYIIGSLMKWFTRVVSIEVGYFKKNLELLL